MQNENYRNDLGISQSAIKDFKKMPPIEWKKIWIDKTKEHKDTESTIFGSLVDNLLFSPEEVDEQFITCEVKKPSDSISYIVEKAFDMYQTTKEERKQEVFWELQDLGLSIVEFAKNVPMLDGKKGYGQGWKEATLVEKVVKEGEEYFSFLKTTNGKRVISSGDYMDALLVAEAVKSNPISAPYVDRNCNEFQVEIFHEGLKGALDIVHRDEKENTIRVVDFKTAESAYYFSGNVWRFGYLEQQVIYDRLFRGAYEAILYDILPPINLVIDRTYKIPYIYEYSWRDIKNSWKGYVSNSGKAVKGLKDYIEDIKWHIDKDLWDYPREHYENGSITLNLTNND